jgi:protein arginine kinase
LTDPFPHAAVPADAIARGAPWLCCEGALADVVVSSRIRLARNLMGLPFPSRCSPPQREAVMQTCRERLGDAGMPGVTAVSWTDVHRLAALERQVLLERHLISKEHAAIKKEPAAKPMGPAKPAAAPCGDARAVAFSLPDETLSVMVNEEDHLRIQVLRPGLALSDAWTQINQTDDALEATMDFAFHPRFGYLTACPTNVGCGVRMSVMLHLPALRLSGDIEKVRRAAKDMSLALRGFYGENTEAAGDLFQVSNQTTLGKTEAIILHELEKEIIPQVVAFEQAARRTLLEKRRRALEDQVYRALGLLKSARLLTPEEAIAQLSLVRLGILVGLVKGIEQQVVTQLFLLTQPAHLQRLLGREMDQQQRREARADLVRERIGSAG